MHIHSVATWIHNLELRYRYEAGSLRLEALTCSRTVAADTWLGFVP